MTLSLTSQAAKTAPANTVNEPEVRLVERFARQIQTTVPHIERSFAVSFYVAMKTKQITILVGPANAGKRAVVQAFGHSFSGGDYRRFQEMVGHAWWASLTQHSGLYSEAQQRLNDDKLLGLFEEALRPENADHLYTASLTRISPAEVAGLFSLLAAQQRHRRMMRLPTRHLDSLMPYPENLRVIGTLDGALPTPLQDDILASVTVIDWPYTGATPRITPTTLAPYGCEKLFLASCARSRPAAISRLAAIGDVLPMLTGVLWGLVSSLERHGIACADAIADDVIRYAANAWVAQGPGLFAEQESWNLVFALDFALCYYLMPRINYLLASQPELRLDLLDWCAGRYPHLMRSLRQAG